MSHTNMQLESLEMRRHMSVSATTFFGPPTVGTTWTYDGSVNGGPTSQHTIKVAGTAKIAGVNALRLTTSQKVGSSTVSGSAYDTVDNVKGVVQYKAQTTTVSGKTKTTVTMTYAPPAVSCPPKLNAGKTYKYVWNSLTETLVGSSRHSARTTRTYTIKLLSDKTVKVKVPAGTYSAYALQTTTTTSVGASSFTTTNNLWIAPGVGMVKSVTTSNGVTTTGLLASFKRGRATAASVGAYSTTQAAPRAFATDRRTAASLFGESLINDAVQQPA